MVGIKLMQKQRAIKNTKAIIIGIGTVIIISGLVVIALLQPKGSLVFDTTDQTINFTDTDSDGLYDKVEFCVINEAKVFIKVETVAIEVNTVASDSGWIPVIISNTSLELPRDIRDKTAKTHSLPIVCIFEAPAGAWTFYRIVITFRKATQSWQAPGVDENGTMEDPMTPVWEDTTKTIISTVYEFSEA